MKKIKILFTIQWYPSVMSANGICDENIIRALVATGKFEIHCLSYRMYGMPKFECIDGVQVHRFNKGFSWSIYKWLSISKKWNVKLVEQLSQLCLRIKQLLTIPIYPFCEPINIIRFRHAALKLMKQENFDLIVSEHNGLDSIIAGYTIKKKYPFTKFIPIYWDSMTGGFPPKYLPHSFSKQRKFKLELKINSNADRIIYTETSQKINESTFKNQSFYKYVTYLNIPYLIIDKSSYLPKYPSEIINKEKINIVFAGSISNRNPEYLFKLFNNLNNKQICLNFICHEKYHSYLLSKADKYNINILCIPYMEHNKLSQVLYYSDFLLNIGVTNPNAISGKIFEYMSYLKPIISTYKIDNEACIPFLKQYPLSLLIDERLEIHKNAKILQTFIIQNKGKTADLQTIYNNFETSMPEAYVKIFDKIINT